MRIIVAALVALAVILGLVAPVSALDPQTFWEQQEHNLP